ncbi:hypothetical protein SEA_PRAIRIE_41 [Arthrobacter phage Prairie]|uniref:Uncharacterized protein n=1 Tax=Arthrobacter phage Prairie TaxID=2816463 RepID=A0A8A5LRV0_9CAUD|nr:hypothetical protein SEA_PRAIRIE_41 [Arthrobacter phage Prairie]
MTETPRYNTYEPGEGIEDARAHIGRPVLVFAPSGSLMPGTVVRVLRSDADGVLVYDVAALAITAKGPGLVSVLRQSLRLGDLLNPQPNTFVFTA